MPLTSSRSNSVEAIAEDSGFVVASRAMTELLTMAERAAESPAKVLITGESGVGKDLVARYIHGQSARKPAPFVAVNCAGLTETLLESELFGHVKGSFTGAYRDKRGKIQLAHRGTLFLDEVGEMSLRMQALLLRFLENGEIQAVGSDQSHTRVDVRVMAATNRNLSDHVAAGQFREDLLYRLRVIHLPVPPLRERPEDIQVLKQHFLARSGGNWSSRTMRCGHSSVTGGPATCASCSTWSSSWCGCPRQAPSKWSICRYRCAADGADDAARRSAPAGR